MLELTLMGKSVWIGSNTALKCVWMGLELKTFELTAERIRSLREKTLGCRYGTIIPEQFILDFIS